MDSSTRPASAVQVRIGDRERDACLNVLNAHHVEGRLDLDELNRRQQAALLATTSADLDALLADLPRRRPLPGLTADGWPLGPTRGSTGVPLGRGLALKVARHAGAAVVVGMSAWLGTKGIDDAAVRGEAWNAAWMTGAVGYLGALFTRGIK